MRWLTLQNWAMNEYWFEPSAFSKLLLYNIGMHMYIYVVYEMFPKLKLNVQQPLIAAYKVIFNTTHDTCIIIALIRITLRFVIWAGS